MQSDARHGSSRLIAVKGGIPAGQRRQSDPGSWYTLRLSPEPEAEKQCNVWLHCTNHQYQTKEAIDVETHSTILLWLTQW